ncbi:MAG: alkaline phosphatase family protein [Candidatus Asgardarchaeia archaeon]
MNKSKVFIVWVTLLLILSLVPLSGSIVYAQVQQTDYYGRLAVIVIIDGLEPSVLPTLNLTTLPALASEGAYTYNATTVLPSATTVAHAALATGCYPEKNGIANTIVINSTDWHLSSSDTPTTIYVPSNLNMVRQVPSLLELASQQGISTALIVGKSKLSVMGPAGRFYLLPSNYTEYGSYDVYDQQFPFSLRLKQDEWIINTSIEYLSSIEKILKLGSDALLVVNLPATDWTGHAYGPSSNEYAQIVENADHQIGRLVDYIKSNFSWTHTLFMVTADHGFSDTNPANVAMTVKTRWSAITVDHYAIEAGGRALYIYLKNPSDLDKAISDAWDSGIAKAVYSKWNTTALVNGTLSDIHLNTTFAGDLYVVLKDGYTAYNPSRGSHGGTDEQNIPLFIAGWNINKNSDLDNARIIDLLPTALAFLGVHLPSYLDGHVLNIFTQPYGNIQLNATNYLPEVDESITIHAKYFVNTTNSQNLSLNVSFAIFDENGSLIQVIKSSSMGSKVTGDVTTSYTPSKDGTYYIIATLQNGENFIASASIKIVVIPAAQMPWAQIIAAVAITIVLGVVILIIPIKFKEKF